MLLFWRYFKLLDSFGNKDEWKSLVQFAYTNLEFGICTWSAVERPRNSMKNPKKWQEGEDDPLVWIERTQSNVMLLVMMSDDDELMNVVVVGGCELMNDDDDDDDDSDVRVDSIITIEYTFIKSKAVVINILNIMDFDLNYKQIIIILQNDDIL